MAAPPPVASTSTAAIALDTTSAVGEPALSTRRGSTRIRESFAALAAQEKGELRQLAVRCRRGDLVQMSSRRDSEGRVDVLARGI